MKYFDSIQHSNNTAADSHVQDKGEKDPSIWNSSFDTCRNSELELIFYGYEECAPSKSFGPGQKGAYKIHYVHCGKGSICYKDKWYSVHAGECFIFYPDAYIYYEADVKNPWSYSWVAFNGTNAEFYLKRANITKNDIVVKTFDLPTLEDAFNRLMQINLSDPTKDLKFISLLYTILATFIPVSEPDQNDNFLHTSAHVKNALEYIRVHYSDKITIAQIASYLSLERKYFAKIFKEQLRMPPQTYLTNYRLSKACELLQNSDMSIYEIAEKVGYDNQFSFSRAFKKFYNISPAAYRTQNQFNR